MVASGQHSLDCVNKLIASSTYRVSIDNVIVFSMNSVQVVSGQRSLNYVTNFIVGSAYSVIVSNMNQRAGCNISLTALITSLTTLNTSL